MPSPNNPSNPGLSRSRSFPLDLPMLNTLFHFVDPVNPDDEVEADGAGSGAGGPSVGPEDEIALVLVLSSCDCEDGVGRDGESDEL